MAVIVLKPKVYTNKLDKEIKNDNLAIMHFYIKKMYSYYTQEELRNAIITTISGMGDKSKSAFYNSIAEMPTIKIIYDIIKMPYYTEKQCRMRYKEHLSKGLAKGNYNDAMQAFLYYLAASIENKSTYNTRHSLVKELFHSNTTSMNKMVCSNTLSEVKLRSIALFIHRFFNRITEFQWNSVHPEWDRNGLKELFEDLAGNDNSLKNIYEVYYTSTFELKNVINTTAKLYRKELEK